MADDTSTKTTKRLLSLDVFRGATIAGMMLVNNPGDWNQIYAPWKHAAWDGWTFTDTIFPFFLWIVGVAMTLSFAKRVERGDNKGSLALHVLQRSAIIFVLGLVLSGFPFGLAFGHKYSFATMRIPGVLQRIAVCYLVGGLIYLWSGFRVQIAVTVGLLVVYWLAMAFIPVPEYGAGVLAPTGNLCWYIDSTLLRGHTWSGAPAPGFDPEGIFSTLPAVATVMFGVFTGHLLRSKLSDADKTVWMFVIGNLLVLTGLIMDNWLPINKNLWTSSYSVFMAGLALNVFALCYWIIDVVGIKWWAKPFQINGLNAITVFFLAGLIGRLTSLIRFDMGEGTRVSLRRLYYDLLFVPIGDPMLASFIHAIAFMMGLYLIAYIMYKMNWIIKV